MQRTTTLYRGKWLEDDRTYDKFIEKRPLGVRGQRTEVRGQRSEVRGQRSEVRGQKTEDR
jgi:hypothetical protein